MRIKRNVSNGIVECDMTPMIDMTFQLLAFFMVIVNFTEADVNDRVKLPKSVLAKPPDRPLEKPITLHLTSQGTVIYGIEEFSVPALPAVLRRERSVVESEGRQVSEANIIIRADAKTKTAKVQELIKICQENHFEKFVLRAREQVD